MSQDFPLNAKGRKLLKLGTLNPTMCTTLLPRAHSLGNVEEQDDILRDVECGAGHPLSNLFRLSIQMPYQRLARRYWTGLQHPYSSLKLNGNEFFD